MTAKRFGIIGNPEKEEARDVAETLVGLLTEIGATQCSISSEFDIQSPIVTPLSSQLEIAKSSDTIFSLGGDGTMLSSARAIIRANPTAELIGVNLGKLGFLAENPPSELHELVTELKERKLVKEMRSLLRATVESTSHPENGTTIRRDALQPDREGSTSSSFELTALNEIVVDNYGSTRMLTFEIFIEGSLMGTIRADGLIVATPTGSTGYAVSAGGPIVEPSSPVHIITPIAPHTLTVRPLIVPDSYEIKLHVSSAASTPMLVVVDGQEEIISETPAVVTLSHYPTQLHLLRRKQRTYFDLLRTKLLWSADARELGRW
jgi:NAD+ kinase